MSHIFRIATRGSPLALAQARLFERALQSRLAGASTELLTFTTQGDRHLDTPFAELGGKEVFTKELDTALLQGQAEFAVHSCKDLPASLAPGLRIAAVLSREDPRDALIGPAASLQDLASGTRIGTASIRRRAQILSVRSDLEFALIRGNIGTRLQKLKNGEAEALLLAAAGLERLEMSDQVAGFLPLSRYLPAPGQGLIVVLGRSDASDEAQALACAVEHRASRLAAEAERAFQARLEGSCYTPIAAHCAVAGQVAQMMGEVLSLDGQQRWRAQETLLDCADHETARALGRRLAERILDDGAILETAPTSSA